MIEKTVNIEVKANFQPPSRTKEIDSRCPKDHRLSVKKDKDKANWEHQFETLKVKVKSHNSFSANQPQAQAPKEDK